MLVRESNLYKYVFFVLYFPLLLFRNCSTIEIMVIEINDISCISFWFLGMRSVSLFSLFKEVGIKNIVSLWWMWLELCFFFFSYGPCSDVLLDLNMHLRNDFVEIFSLHKQVEILQLSIHFKYFNNSNSLVVVGPNSSEFVSCLNWELKSGIDCA